jgi:hypothetical protein
MSTRPASPADTGDEQPTTIQPAPKPEPAAVTLRAHPRARASVRRWRAWAGLAGFALTLFLSLSHGVPAWDAGARALGLGIAAHFAAWICGVAVWRQLVVGELLAAEAARSERRRELAAGA